MFADIPGARIWYEDTGGDGTPIVLLHASTGSVAMWKHQLPAFAAAGYRCIAYDRRGHGRTECDAFDVPPSEDLRGLADRLGLAAFHLLGTAAGGIVAFDFVLSNAERVRTLTVANSIGGVQDADYLALQRRLRPSPEFDALPPEVRELGPAYRAADPAGTQRWIDLEHASRTTEEIKRPASRNRVTFESLEGIRAPTLLITGDADLYTPPPVLELFRQRIRGAQSVVLPNCGHSAYWEQPELFNRTVLDFLSGAARSP
jgi:pimeloyl-ACP methyl ester carboxylesterase